VELCSVAVNASALRADRWMSSASGIGSTHRSISSSASSSCFFLKDSGSTEKDLIEPR
jgi:hypothetical protein